MVEKLQTVSGAITVLVDNTIMELVPDSTFVKRLSKPPANFLAEQGFSVFIETGNRKILWMYLDFWMVIKTCFPAKCRN